jgi:hypothetical protein
MKKVLSILKSLCLLCMLAAGCAEKAGTPAEVAELTTKAIPGFVDLTKLSSTMVYAEVYNIMSSPTDYEGKTIKAGGLYKAERYELAGPYYHFVVIADAAACCAQGLEFAWTGDHAYPKDYPKDGALIEVTGVFGRYEEKGHTYYHLVVDEIVAHG